MWWVTADPKIKVTYLQVREITEDPPIVNVAPVVHVAKIKVNAKGRITVTGTLVDDFGKPSLVVKANGKKLKLPARLRPRAKSRPAKK